MFVFISNFVMAATYIYKKIIIVFLEAGMLNYKLKFISIFFFLSLLIFSSVQANPSIYGRFDIAISNIDKANKGSTSDVKSHASRIGIKGSQIFDNGLTAIYQYEWQTDPIDGDPTLSLIHI